MLSSASALRKYEIHDATRIISETFSGGASGSFDPLPMGARDGFLVGYDNSNSTPDADTKSATRLAFRNGEDPVHPRHGTLVLRMDGQIEALKDNSSTRVEKRGKVPSGPWVP